MTDAGTQSGAKELTRTERRRLETRQLLLDAVVELLLEQRDPRLSSTAIAERADVAVGTFYNHFLSVQEAIDEAFNDLTPFVQEGAKDITSSGDICTGFGNALASLLYRLHTEPDMWRAARIAGWEVRPFGDYVVVRAFIAAGVGIGDASEEEIAATGTLFTRLLTSLVDQFGQHDVDLHLPEQAARIIASVALGDADAVERVVRATSARFAALMDEMP